MNWYSKVTYLGPHTLALKDFIFLTKERDRIGRPSTLTSKSASAQKLNYLSSRVPALLSGGNKAFFGIKKPEAKIIDKD
jgi:hypothetical protein